MNQDKAINLLTDVSHNFSFNLSNASRTQEEVYQGINVLTNCKTLYKCNLSNVNALVLLVNSKLPYAPGDAEHIRSYVKNGGGLYISGSNSGEYKESLDAFLKTLHLKASQLSKPIKEKVFTTTHAAAVPDLEFNAKISTKLLPLNKNEKWSAIYKNSHGEPLTIAMRLGKGVIVADTAQLYNAAINNKEPSLTKAMRRLLEYISAFKQVTPLKGGGGWACSKGYQHDLMTKTDDGLKICYNEYTAMLIPADTKAYKVTSKIIARLSGVTDKQKAEQIKSIYEQRKLLSLGERISVDISGVKKLTLETTDGGDGNGCDHSVWADAFWIDNSGKKKKVLLKNAVEVMPGYGTASQDTHNDQPIEIGDKVFKTGIYIHAPGKLVYNIDGEYKKFTAYIGCQSSFAGSVGFKVTGDGKLIWKSQKVHQGAGGKRAEEDEDVLFTIKYLACRGSGFAGAQTSFVDSLIPELKDDYRKHLGIFAHELGHSWDIPFTEPMGEEGMAFLFNNLVLNDFYGQKHNNAVTNRLMGYLKNKDLGSVDLATTRGDQKYYMFLDLMVRQYGEEVFKNYHMLKTEILGKPDTVWNTNTSAYLWSIAAGKNIFPYLNNAFDSTCNQKDAVIPDKLRALGFDTGKVGKMYGIKITVPSQKRDILGKMKNFSDVRRFYKKEHAEKGNHKIEG